MNFETEIELLKKSVLLDKEQNVLNQKQILKRIKKIENKQEENHNSLVYKNVKRMVTLLFL